MVLSQFVLVEDDYLEIIDYSIHARVDIALDYGL